MIKSSKGAKAYNELAEEMIRGISNKKVKIYYGSEKKSGLGKGLDAIFAENDTEANSSSTVMLRLDEIEPNREQPRKEFNEESLTELADSIAQHGVIQPLLVRPPRGWRIPNCSG